MGDLRLYRYTELREVFVLARDPAAAEARGRIAVEDGTVHLSHDGAELATDAEGVSEGTIPACAVALPPEEWGVTVRQWAERGGPMTSPAIVRLVIALAPLAYALGQWQALHRLVRRAWQWATPTTDPHACPGCCETTACDPYCGPCRRRVGDSQLEGASAAEREWAREAVYRAHGLVRAARGMR